MINVAVTVLVATAIFVGAQEQVSTKTKDYDTTCINNGAPFQIKILNGPTTAYYSDDAKLLFNSTTDSGYCFTSTSKNGRFLYNCAAGTLKATHYPTSKHVHITGTAIRCKSTWSKEICNVYLSTAGTCTFDFVYPVSKSGSGLQSMLQSHPGGGSIKCIDEIFYLTGGVPLEGGTCQSPNWRNAFRITPTNNPATTPVGTGQVFNDRDKFPKGHWNFLADCLETPSVGTFRDISLPKPRAAKIGDDKGLGDEQCRYVGCYVDASGSGFQEGKYMPNILTVPRCRDYCLKLGYFVYGVEYYHYCYCGYEIPNTEKRLQKECNTYCSGLSSTKCGGNGRAGVNICEGITGRIFEDTNKNGRIDTFEPVAGVPVKLYGPKRSLLKSTTSNAQGRYRFSGAYPATYTVKVDLPKGKEFTVDPDVNIDGSHEVEIFPLNRTSNSNNRDFGFVKIDQCSRGTHNCHRYAFCLDGPERFTCECKYGYTGDGKTCTRVKTECTNGSLYEVDSKRPYCPPGSICGDVNECREGFHNCNPLATCINTFGSFRCVCVSGTKGDGVTECTGQITCGNQVCDPKGTSVGICTDNQRDIEGLFRIPNPVCMCHIGFSSSGGKCVPNRNTQCKTQCNSRPSSSCLPVGTQNFFCEMIRDPKPGCPLWHASTILVNSVWRWVAFPRSFKVVPVVIAGPPTLREKDNAHILINGVNKTGFRIKIIEPEACGNRIHGNEMVSYLAVVPDVDVLISGSTIFFRAGLMDVQASSPTSTPFFITPNSGHTISALIGQMQEEDAENIGSVYASHAAKTNGYLDIVPAPGSNFNKAQVGWIALINAPVTSGINMGRVAQMVIRDQCSDRNSLMVYSTLRTGFGEGPVYYGQLPRVSPVTPHIFIGGWGTYNVANIPTVAAPGIGNVYTNFRLVSKRASSALVRAETFECLGDRSPLSNNPWITYFAIFPEIENWAVRGTTSKPHRRDVNGVNEGERE